MKILIGSDHRGFDLKQELITGVTGIIDIGCFSRERCDYPDIVQSLINNEFDFGVLICNTGIGMSVCANKYPGISAALCMNSEMAQSSREHTNCNVLVLPSAFVDFPLALKMIHIFVGTKFFDGVYKNRVEKFLSLLKK